MKKWSKSQPARQHRALMLRTCDADMSSFGGFAWPRKGYVAAPDWDPREVCGGGLHGLLWGHGNCALIPRGNGQVWMVVEVDAREVVDLGGKVKVPRGRVLYAGDQVTATQWIEREAPEGKRGGCHLITHAGDYGTATAGDHGTATAGDYGTATAGYGGTATAGEGGTATAGEGGEIRIQWWDGKRYRCAIGYVSDGIAPNVAHQVNDKGELAPA